MAHAVASVYTFLSETFKLINLLLVEYQTAECRSAKESDAQWKY